MEKIGDSFNLINLNEIFCYSSKTEPLSNIEKINSKILINCQIQEWLLKKIKILQIKILNLI